MVVRRIKECISQLDSFTDLNEFDARILADLHTHFDSITDDDELNESEHRFLLDVFERRWRHIADTTEDYTYNALGINGHWIALAKTLAASETLELTFIHILMPDVKNRIDPNLLSRLTDCSELRHFYRGFDEQILHHVRGLFKQWHKIHKLATYRSHDDLTLYPVSLLELNRIREKNIANLQFRAEGQVYPSFWKYMSVNIFPRLGTPGECPRLQVFELFTVIKHYFENPDDLLMFRQNMLQWSRNLCESHIDDVNWLYGQRVIIAGQSIFLLELLLDCLQSESHELETKLIALFRWLLSIDKSFFIPHDALNQVYQEAKAGPYFNSAQLHALLSECEQDAPLELRIKLQNIRRAINAENEITKPIIALLKDLYRVRWRLVNEKELDYTCTQEGRNAPWILLAQRLAGAGWIDPNYYLFLMPTLIHDEELISKEMLTAYPLSHYILSEEGTGLILLEQSVRFYKLHGTFSKFSEDGSLTPFSSVEVERILRSNPRFRKYGALIIRDEEEKPPVISIRVVHAIKKLVDESLYPNGLLYAHTYESTQMASAEAAYHRFALFLESLDDDERQRLNRQQMIFQGRKVTFAQVLLKVEQGDCVAILGQYLAKLVIDYAPYVRFRDDIEERVDLTAMRSTSKRRFCREDLEFEHNEACRKILILCHNILTRSFSYWPYTGQVVSVFGYSNTIPQEVREVLLRAMPLVVGGEANSSRFVLAELLASVVIPTINNNRGFTWLCRPSDTQQWFQSIADGSLYKRPDSWFDSSKLLVALSPLSQKLSRKCLKLDSFLDKLIRMRLNEQNPMIRELCINLQFTNLLASFDADTKMLILKTVRTVKQPVDGTTLQTSYVNHILHRLAFIGAMLGYKTAHSTSLFRMEYAPIHEQKYKTLQERMAPYAQKDNLMATLESLHHEVVCKKSGMNPAMRRYWHLMTEEVRKRSNTKEEADARLSLTVR